MSDASVSTQHTGRQHVHDYIKNRLITDRDLDIYHIDWTARKFEIMIVMQGWYGTYVAAADPLAEWGSPLRASSNRVWISTRDASAKATSSFLPCRSSS